MRSYTNGPNRLSRRDAPVRIAATAVDRKLVAGSRAPLRQFTMALACASAVLSIGCNNASLGAVPRPGPAGHEPAHKPFSRVRVVGHKPADKPFSLLRVVGQNRSTVERYLGKPIKTLPQQYYVFKGHNAVVEVIASFYEPKVRRGYPMWDMAVIFRRQLTLQQALELTGLQSAPYHFTGGSGIPFSYDGLRVVGAPLMEVSMLSQEGLKTISPPRLFISVPGHP
ncbi:MAG: hypothetical protein KGJ62_13870 [Armatimonadetes bacterium]|nr:hypothetical protein [Armatimonadota bacterium]MDE2206372.1 hypothetical protein [Armatimonadota bacterium]